MKRAVTVYAWLVVAALIVFWVCGLVVGATLAKASADGYNCTSFSGFNVSTQTCESQPDEDGSFERCTVTYAFGFGQSRCDTVYPPPPAPLPAEVP